MQVGTVPRQRMAPGEHGKITDVGGYVVPYSVDPDHYIALCKSCHTTFDKQAQCCS